MFHLVPYSTNIFILIFLRQAKKINIKCTIVHAILVVEITCIWNDFLILEVHKDYYD